MMASINPLGERARGNRWWRTAGAFLVGCAVGGWVLGALAGLAGLLVALAVPVPAGALLLLAAGLLLCAGLAEVTAFPVPTMHRQVDDAWLGRYRGWVYGAGFGAQLGAGLTTTVTTTAVYAMVGVAVMLGAAGQPWWAQAVGVVFGLARAAPVLGGWTLRDPEHLRRWARRAAAVAAGWRVATGWCLCALAAWGAANL